MLGFSYELRVIPNVKFTILYASLSNANIHEISVTWISMEYALRPAVDEEEYSIFLQPLPTILTCDYIVETQYITYFILFTVHI